MQTATCPINQKPAVSRPTYRPRRPRRSPLYRLLEDHFEDFLGSYDEHFQNQYGPLRPAIQKTVYKFLDCGILEHGCARVVCKNCKIGPFSFEPEDVAFLLIPEELHERARIFFEEVERDHSGPAYLCPSVDPAWDRNKILRALREE